MSYTSTSRRSTPGFTIVEMLVIAPIAMLLIAGIIAFITTIVGDTLISSERNTMTWQIQSSLDQIENDVRLSTSINATSGTMPSPQGNGGGTAAFTSDSAIILTQFATTQNPYNTARTLIYLANPSSACNTNIQYTNPTLSVQVIYFISGGALYRRTSYPLPIPATCGGATPWQTNSCAAIGTSPCIAKDQLMLTDATMALQYYTDPSTTANATAATNLTSTLRVTLSATRTIAGSSISNSGVMRATRLNSNQ